MIALSVVWGCGEEHEYVGAGDYAFAMTEDTPAFAQTEDFDVFIIEQNVGLPIRPPSPDEYDARQSVPDGLVIPYSSLPWVERGQIETEIDFTISNLLDEPAEVTVTLNGVNEFHEYFPGVVVVDDEALIEFAQWEKTYQLAPFERRNATIREEELDEVTVDLATVVNGAPNSNEIVYFESQSALDPRAQAYIPPIIPALVGVRMGLRTLQPSRLVLELSVRVRDVDDRIVADGEAPWEPPKAAPFVPVMVAPP